MVGCVAWCERMVAKASEEGNYEDWQNYSTLLAQWKGRCNEKLFKSKKVVGALVALAIALVSVGLGVDLGSGTESSVTDVVCQVITCE